MHSIKWVIVMYNYYNNLTPSFMNVLKPRKSITSRLLSENTTKSIMGFVNNAQKIINIYNQAAPIIEQTKPMLNNIRTTFKVAKAFKRFSNDSSLEKAFDNLPDFEEKPKEEKKETQTKVTNPFYP